MKPNDTLTLSLTGDVSLDDFAQAVRALESLLAVLEKEKAGGSNLEWVIDELHAGSATARIRGIGTGVSKVVAEYHRIGHEVEIGRMPHSPAIRKAISELTSVIGRSVSSVRFETAKGDSEIFKAVPAEDAGESGEGADVPAILQNSFGSVQGRIQSITNRKSLQFTLYDLHTDNAVSCYLESGGEGRLRKSWGRIATVSGIVRRNPITGVPTTIRGIKPEGIQLISEMKGSWRDAIGASRARKGEMSPEDAIRKARDG